MSNKKPSRCVLCKKPVMSKFAPFCSQGCKDRDLLQWLGEGYKMPGPPADYADSLNVGEEDGQ